MAQRQQVVADIHIGDDIQVIDQVNVNVANSDTTDDDASSQDSGDIPDQQDGDQSVVVDPQADIQEQWKFLQARERKLAAEKKAFEQQLEDARRQAKLIQAIDARALDPRTDKTIKSPATTESSGIISSIRAPSESFAEILQRTREQVHKQHDHQGEIQLQSTQQLQITALKKDLKNDEKQLKLMLSQIRIMEEQQSHNYTIDRQNEINEYRDEAVELTTQIEQTKIQLSKTEDTAEKFKSFMEMPEYEEAPRGYRREKTVLEPKAIHKAINTTFDPSKQYNNDLDHFWILILRYGRAHYLNEKEHLTVLGECVRGPALATFESCRKRKLDLRQTMNELTVLYGTTVTINDYKQQLNDFQREANESIRKCMVRYTALLMKTKHGVPEQAWIHTVPLKQMTALKQFITAKTRAYIEMKEARNQAEGSSMLPLEYWINRVEEYENAHHQVPQKDMKSVILTATMAPAYSHDELEHNEKQLKHFKINHAYNHELDSKVNRLEHQIQELAVTSAAPKYSKKEFNKKPYDVVKHAQKARYVDKPEKRRDNKMEVDEYNPSFQHRADKKEGELPPPLMPTQAPTPAKQVEQQQQQQQQQWPKKEWQAGQKKNYQGQNKNYQGQNNNNRNWQPNNNNKDWQKDRPRAKIFKINGKFYGNLEEMAHNPNYVKNYQNQQQSYKNQRQQQQVNNVGMDSDDDDPKEESEEEEEEMEIESDPEIVELVMSEN